MRILLRLLNTPLVIPALGRWNLNYTPAVVSRIVDQANEDHCGCCQVVVEPLPDTYLEPFVLY
jgi:hypothetical protein